MNKYKVTYFSQLTVDNWTKESHETVGPYGDIFVEANNDKEAKKKAEMIVTAKNCKTEKGYLEYKVISVELVR